MTADRANTAGTAERADLATSVSGGSANVTSLVVGGVLIVNTSGQLVADVPWTQLTGVPSGFADNVDNDTLAGVNCAPGNAPRWTGSSWGCVNVDALATQNYANAAAVNAASSAVSGHTSNVNAHHTRYTDNEARAAVALPTSGTVPCPSGWDTYGDLCFYNSRRGADDGTVVAYYCATQLGGHLCTAAEVSVIRGWQGWFGGNFWYGDQAGDDIELFHNCNCGGYWHNSDGEANMADHRAAYCCRSR